MPAKKTVATETNATEKKTTVTETVKKETPAKKAATTKTTAPKKEAAPKKATTKKAAAPKKETVKKEAAPKKAATKKAATPKKETAKKEVAPKKTTTKKSAAPKKTTTKKTTAKKTTKKATVEVNKKSVKDYEDIINWKKGEAHAMDWLYIEVNAGDLLTEVEAGVDNLSATCEAILNCMLEGDGFIVEPSEADKVNTSLTVRYYCDNLSEDRKKYFER